MTTLLISLWINCASTVNLNFCHAGCTGGVGRGEFMSNGIGSGGGHGGRGGSACFNDSCIDGGISYGNVYLPCELGSGSGSGNDSSAYSTSGGGVIGMSGSIHWWMSFYHFE